MPWIVHMPRCPRCRFRFELHGHLADPDVVLLVESEPDDGPGSSSYELEAITDGLGRTDPAADRRDPWEIIKGQFPSMEAVMLRSIRLEARSRRPRRLGKHQRLLWRSR